MFPGKTFGTLSTIISGRCICRSGSEIFGNSRSSEMSMPWSLNMCSSSSFGNEHPKMLVGHPSK
jgi:hypothetical protein